MAVAQNNKRAIMMDFSDKFVKVRINRYHSSSYEALDFS